MPIAAFCSLSEGHIRELILKAEMLLTLATVLWYIPISFQRDVFVVTCSGFIEFY